METTEPSVPAWLNLDTLVSSQRHEWDDKVQRRRTARGAAERRALLCPLCGRTTPVMLTPVRGGASRGMLWVGREFEWRWSWRSQSPPQQSLERAAHLRRHRRRLMSS